MRDAINACKYLFLRECCEPEENTLRVVVEEAKADGPPVALSGWWPGPEHVQEDENGTER